MARKKCKIRYKGKCFRTKRSKSRYKSWEPIIKDAKKDKAPKSVIKRFRKLQKSWIGK